MYMYDGKLGMHITVHFEFPVHTKMISAWKLWLNVNPGYGCTNLGGETIIATIRLFTKFTLDIIRKKLRKKFNTG